MITGFASGEDSVVTLFRVLYTSHSAKKRKIFHDGELRIQIDNKGTNKGSLFDESSVFVYKFNNAQILSQLLSDQPPFDICIGV